jgi:hypothetical protein
MWAKVVSWDLFIGKASRKSNVGVLTQFFLKVIHPIVNLLPITFEQLKMTSWG